MDFKKIFGWVGSNGAGAKVTLLVLILASQATLLLMNLDSSPVQQHALGVHQDTQRMVLDGVIPLASSQAIGGLGPYGPMLIYMLAPFYVISASYYTLLVVLSLLYVGTSYLLYYIGENYFGGAVGLVAAVLFGFSAINLYGAKNPINAAFTPFFGVLLLLSILKYTEKDGAKYLIVGGLSVAMLLQLHYTAYSSVVLVAVSIAYGSWRITRDRSGALRWWLTIGVTLVLVILSFTPYIISDYRQGMVETKQRLAFVFGNAENLGVGMEDTGFLSTMGQNAWDFLLFSNEAHPLRWGFPSTCPDNAGAGSFLLMVANRIGVFGGLMIHLLSLFSLLFLIPWSLLKGVVSEARSRHLLIWSSMWMVFSFLTYIAIPRDYLSPYQALYLTTSIYLVTAISFGLLLRLAGSWRRVLRLSVFFLLIALVISSMVEYRSEKQDGDTLCSQFPVPLGTLVDMQKSIIEEYGTLHSPSMELVNFLWTKIDAWLVEPIGSERVQGKERVLLLQKSGFHGTCLTGNVLYEDGAFLLLGINASTTPSTLQASSIHEEGWQEPFFNDNHWSSHQKSPDCMACGFRVEKNTAETQGKDSTRQKPTLFLRVPFDDLEIAGDHNLLLYLANRGSDVEEIHELFMNGVDILGDVLRPALGEDLLVDIGPYSKSQNNVLSLRFTSNRHWGAEVFLFTLLADSCS